VESFNGSFRDECLNKTLFSSLSEALNRRRTTTARGHILRWAIAILICGLTRSDLDLWAYANEVTLDFSRPGKPTDNAFIEAFNGRFRVECLNAHWFLTLADAREKLEAWRRDYNEVRPHSAIGYDVPIAVQNREGETSPPS